MTPAYYELDGQDIRCRDKENPQTDPLDLLPEFCHYRDEGCDLAASCLNCPFPDCVYELPGGRQRWLKRKRDAEINRLFTAEGKTAGELAGMFGISLRTVQRALKTPPGAATEKDKLPEGDRSENE